MDFKLRRWFIAYQNVRDMLQTRGYVLIDGQNVPADDLQGFQEWYEVTWQGENSLSWIEFQHDVEPDLRLALIPREISQGPNGVSPDDIIGEINSHDMEIKRRGAVGEGRRDRTTDAIIIVDSVNNPSVPKLNIMAAPILSRRELLNYLSPILEVFTCAQMQINPTKFCLQPDVQRHIKLEAEIEALRQHLIRSSTNKDRPIDEILPILRLGRPIAIWYGARVGDVFQFEREIGGSASYLRIVLPETKVEKDAKLFKKANDD